MLLTKAAPRFAVPWIDLQDSLKIFRRFSEILTCTKNKTNGIHSRNRVRIRPERMLISRHCFFKVAHKLRQCACPRLLACRSYTKSPRDKDTKGAHTNLDP